MEVGEMQRGNKEGGADHTKDSVFTRVCLRTHALKAERGGAFFLKKKGGGGTFLLSFGVSIAIKSSSSAGHSGG